MHISCEKCATTYVLDEALIPSSGTAVQCTRCSHVFTAFPPSVTEAPAPVALIEDEPTTSRRKVELPPSAAPRGVNQTIAFGSSAPGAFGSSAPGAFGSSAPGSAPSAGARGASPAVSFGTAAAQQQASPVRGAASAANQTLVFGGAPKGPQGLAEPAGRSDATLPPGPGAGHVPLSFGTLAGQGSSAKTQPLTFGGPGLGQSPGNQTLAFGTVGGQRSANAGPAQGAAGNQTLAFGAVPGAAAGSPKATQVFGTAPVQAAPNQTVAFGAVPGAAAGGPKATQAFGAAPVQAASNQASAFGGAPSGAAGNPKSTQVFGTAPVSPQASGNQTLVFGGGAAKAPPGFGALAGAPRPGAETVPFGKSADAAAVSAASKTIAFGPVGSMPAVPKVTAGTVEISGEAEPEGPRESTVRVSLDAVMREQEDETVEQRHDRTQRYAMADTPGPQDEGGGQPPDRYNRTALFAMSSLQETTRPDAHKPPAVEQTPQPAVVVAQLDAAPSANGRGVDILDPVSTLPLDDAPAPAPAALERSAANAAPADFSSAMTPVPIDLTSTLRGDGPVSATMPNLPSIDRGGAGPTPLPLSMNLVTDEALPPVADPKPRVIERPGADLPLDGVEQMVARSRRRNTIAIVVVLMVVLAAGLGVAYTLFGKALLTPGISPEARASVEQSVTKLRLDDQATRQTEVARLESMVKEY
ncbi:MAG: zinc-ribbon domain-containing protein, partial [Myxococcaceae bacterium]|nr:zinc-ribbon domain-containing protein [Myxococcaceae bacterium]